MQNSAVIGIATAVPVGSLLDRAAARASQGGTFITSRERSKVMHFRRLLSLYPCSETSNCACQTGEGTSGYGHMPACHLRAKDPHHAIPAQHIYASGLPAHTHCHSCTSKPACCPASIPDRVEAMATIDSIHATFSQVFVFVLPCLGSHALH